jgi:maleylpyruvate isomerase
VKALGHGQDVANAWAHDVIAEGLAACEALLRDQPGPFCFGAAPGLADIALVPQVYNARRFGVDLAAMPRLVAADAACLAMPAFAEAAPERQADAE